MLCLRNSIVELPNTQASRYLAADNWDKGDRSEDFDYYSKLTGRLPYTGRPETMRAIHLITLFLLIQCHSVLGQDDRKILKIRNEFNEWQSRLENNKVTPKFYYHWIRSDNDENGTWTPFEPGDSVTVIEVARVFSQPGLGHLVKLNTNSISGDWFIKTENYFDSNGDLFFIFWSMNTFQADVPVTVEKRLYFDGRNGLMKELKTVYKMNSRDVVEVRFADREVIIYRK